MSSASGAGAPRRPLGGSKRHCQLRAGGRQLHGKRIFKLLDGRAELLLRSGRKTNDRRRIARDRKAEAAARDRAKLKGDALLFKRKEEANQQGDGVSVPPVDIFAGMASQKAGDRQRTGDPASGTAPLSTGTFSSAA